MSATCSNGFFHAAFRIMSALVGQGAANRRLAPVKGVHVQGLYGRPDGHCRFHPASQIRISIGNARRRQISCCTQHVWGYVASMDWQQLASLAIVGIAAALMLRSRFRRPKTPFSIANHCGGCAGIKIVPKHSVVYHARKGERPRVVVKMK